MRIGIPKEIKTLEFRVGMTPAGVHEMVHEGHEVVVETNAGAGIGVTDADYEKEGATVLGTAEEVFEQAEMIVKVKEPQLNECEMLRPDQVLFTYLHLAPDPKQTEALVKSGTTAIAYETVTAKDGSLPLLTPMSEVAGRLSIQAGAYALQKANGGSGKLLGGVPGVFGELKVGQIEGHGIAGPQSQLVFLLADRQAFATAFDEKSMDGFVIGGARGASHDDVEGSPIAVGDPDLAAV